MKISNQENRKVRCRKIEKKGRTKQQHRKASKEKKIKNKIKTTPVTSTTKWQCKNFS